MASGGVGDDTAVSPIEHNSEDETEDAGPCAEKYSKKEIEAKIANGSATLVERRNAKSQIWKLFKIVVVDGVESRHVQCSNCEDFFTYDSRIGSSHLTRHKCVKKGGMPLTQFGFSRRRPVPDYLQKQALVKARQFCTKDIRAIRAIEGEGFMALLQFCLDQNPGLRVRDLMPHRTTVSRAIVKDAETLRDKLIPELTQIAAQGGLSCTADFWTDKFTQTDYLSLTAHYVTADFSLVERVLATAEFTTKHTAENTIDFLRKMLQRFGIHEHFDKLRWTTDHGSNFVAALRDYNRCRCVAHTLNTVLAHTFDERRVLEENECVAQLISDAKVLVAFFKRSGLNKQLNRDNKLKQEVATRWNSIHTMLSSVLESYDAALEVLQEYRSGLHLPKIEGISKKVLSDVVLFLAPFKQASDELESDSQHTIQLVLPYWRRLERHCEVTNADVDYIADLKRSAAGLLETKSPIEEIHYVACVLTPKRGVKHLAKPYCSSIIERTEHQQTVRRMAAELVSTGVYATVMNADRVGRSTQADGADATTTAGAATMERSSSRQSNSSDVYSDLAESDDVVAERDELSIYLETSDYTTEQNPLSYWKSRRETYPLLSLLARNVFGIPASSASSERDFSVAGHTLSNKRTRLNPTTVDSILFLHSNDK